MFDVSILSTHQENHETFEHNQVIFADGEPSNGKMYVLLEGVAAVYKNYEKPGEICIAELEPGAFFGEMALFLDMGRTATIVAKGNVVLYRFDRESTLAFINSHPITTFSFMQALCSKINASNTISANVSDESHEVKTMANKDPLTGVRNRRYFMDTASYMIESSQIREENLFIAIFDLDLFKKVNDTYGHQAGDHVLVAFSALINDLVRSDDIFARYGGEEFVLLATCNNKKDAAFFIDRLRQKTSELAIDFEGARIPISTSIGVAAITPQQDVQEAIAQADIALYNAKNNGRNRTVFYERGMEL